MAIVKWGQDYYKKDLDNYAFDHAHQTGAGFAGLKSRR
jgi:hypothetical protein